jgi:hypothetical protein
MKQTIIIGTGTGRCGTKSLATLLNKQPSSRVTHERYKYNVPFPPDSYYSNQLIKDCAFHKRTGYYLIGDVALQWIWYANDLMKVNGLKMVYLRRHPLEVHDSFVRKVKPYGYHHWEKNGATPSEWDKAYPYFKIHGLAKYIELSQMTALDMSEKYPGWFRIMDMEDLNDPEAQVELFNWLGMNNYIVDATIHENSTKK